MTQQINFPTIVTLAADITLQSPLHITSATGKGAYNPETGRLYRYEAKTGLGCALTATQSVGLKEITVAPKASAEGDSTDDVYGEAAVNSAMVKNLMPVIPASTINGVLRRRASDLLFASMAMRGHKIDVSTYNTMTSGTATTKVVSELKDSDVLRAARRDPFLCTFGGTSMMLASQLIVSTALPIVRSTEGLHMSPPILDAQSDASIRDLTSVHSVVRRNDVRDLRGAHLDQMIAPDELEAYLSEQADASTAARINKAAKANGSAEESGKKTDLRTLNYLEAVDTGTSFAVRLRLTAYSPEQLGFVIQAFQAMLQQGTFGGKSARGYGRYVVEASRLIVGQHGITPEVVELPLFGDAMSGYAVADDGALAPIMEAGQAYIDDVDPAVLKAFAVADVAQIKKLTVGAKAA